MYDFKHASNKEPNRQFAVISRDSGDDRFLTRRELKHLPELQRANKALFAPRQPLGITGRLADVPLHTPASAPASAEAHSQPASSNSLTF